MIYALFQNNSYEKFIRLNSPATGKKAAFVYI
jgi:hypothetical protein